jgi:hypothetical protein
LRTKAPPDGARADRRPAGLGDEIEQRAQRLIFVVEPTRHGLPFLQPAHLLAQAGIFLMQIDQIVQRCGAVIDHPRRLADGGEDRRQQIHHEGAGALDDEHFGLAEQHQGEGGGEEGEEGETIGSGAQRSGKAKDGFRSRLHSKPRTRLTNL